ncbi:MAG TPA: inositol monophosphatase family protein [Alphaproteobacteria bacterium]|nr:inositol monophosphatase family protein [Alphaproteobacteria bacterium]
MLDLIEPVAGLLKEVAEAEILPRFRNLADEERMEKGENDVVTAADHAAEAFLGPALAGLTRNALIVGEEGAYADPALLDALKDAELAWVIDPLDGTRNFAEGREDFAVMAALLKHGAPVMAWIYQPLTVTMAIAEHGAGATINGDRTKLDVEGLTLPDMTGEFHYGYLPAEYRPVVKEARDKVNTRRPRFCAGATYLNLVRDSRLFAFYYRLMPWDHAPGSLIYQEAGGTALAFDGESYRPASPGMGLLLAPNREIWNTVQKLLFPTVKVTGV